VRDLYVDVQVAVDKALDQGQQLLLAAVLDGALGEEDDALLDQAHVGR
jgi:hypothetical protein